MQQVTYNKAIVWWLLSGVLLIVVMVVIGGITRLTGSGLSIVEWNVISGTLPPLNEAAWMVAFEKYKQFPEYQKLNYSMTLDGFKSIFWWEYLHRLLGRLIGLVFIVPFLYFWFTGQFAGWLKRRMLLILLLGMAQGLMGWLMVKSGLVENPHVSHYRLAAHLCLALALIGTLLWTIADLALPARNYSLPGTIKRYAGLVFFIVLLQIVLGAFVAGLKAGFSYNTYPLMNGELLPSHLQGHLGWGNFLENGVFVQFLHRWVAVVVLLVVLGAWLTARKSAYPDVRTIAGLLLLTTLVQVVLGIGTLLLAVPVIWGVLHQAMAVVLFGLSVLLLHQATSRPTIGTPAKL
ncbi:COX15/CtaA family protein [Pontibacter sp. Tf4]|uniref:COX15/CtaA family protein n=1 Tax=Pontibacter sp. Tf4 TaxID=2761620 RepID=UPI001628A3BA|nr:COX15/CtaA family protein [Pontibacter sp. Tf4]MBB6612421.1 COX15/CtaA family protein [Pontibacter sp. Tf4]